MSVDFQGIITTVSEYLSSFSKMITEKTADLLSSQGLDLSVRWLSLLYLFISILLIYGAIKITKPLIKWILIILGVLLMLGLIIPTW